MLAGKRSWILTLREKEMRNPRTKSRRTHRKEYNLFHTRERQGSAKVQRKVAAYGLEKGGGGTIGKGIGNLRSRWGRGEFVCKTVIPEE